MATIKRIGKEITFWVSVIVPAVIVLALMLFGLGVYDIAYQDGCSTTASFARIIVCLF